MRDVPVLERNQHTADVLALVEQGQRVAITRHGRRVAILGPADPEVLTPLVESGELHDTTDPSRS